MAAMGLSNGGDGAQGLPDPIECLRLTVLDAIAQVYVIFVYRLKHKFIFLTHVKEATMALLITLFVLGWVAAALIGTQAYFRGEQSKPIHERNWRAEGFEQLARSFTGQATDYQERVPAFQVADAYGSRNLTNR